VAFETENTKKDCAMFAVRPAALLLVAAATAPALSTAQAPYYHGQNPGSSYVPNIITVEAGEFSSSVTVGGTVIPHKEVTLTAQLPGRVNYIAGREGESFQGGTTLVAIDDTRLRAKRRQVMADLANSEAAYRNAHMQYTRELWAPQSRSLSRMPGMGLPTLFDNMFTRPLSSAMGQNIPSLERHSDLYSSWTHMNQAQIRVTQARSVLEEIDAQIRDAHSLAPFHGVISRKMTEIGDTVQPGQPLVTFSDTRHLQIKVDVQARLVPGLRKDMIVPALLDVGDQRIDVRVAQIFPVADIQRHTVTVKFDMPANIPGGPGMYAEVMIPDIDSPVQTLPLVPTSALLRRGSLPAVFLINEQGRTELRLVRVGAEMGGGMVSVLSGLKQGDQILANPPTGMRSGQLVVQQPGRPEM
jgi:multidrug efflux pump subunit AcrA (membrane-fusion protein)